MVVFPSETVMPPVGQKSLDWIRTLTADAVARVPDPIRPAG